MSGLQPNEKITAVIAIINIITTIALSIMNYMFLKQNGRLAYKREALVQYYCPLLAFLQLLNIEIKRAESISGFSVFDYKYSIENPRAQEIRLALIRDNYSRFINALDALKQYHYFYGIDKEIYLLQRHIRFMIAILGHEEIYTVANLRKEYAKPNLDILILEIMAAVSSPTILYYLKRFLKKTKHFLNKKSIP